jgi:hypothetical protein
MSNKLEVVNQYFNTNPLLFCSVGILDPDPLVRGTDPDPSITKQK